MLIIQIIAGLSVALLIIKANQWRASPILYSVALITLPLIYVAFAMADNETVIIKELLFGAPYILVGIICLTVDFKASTYCLAILWLIHGAYDLYHDHFFINSGVPIWYPIFCAAVDFIIGFYLLYLAARKPQKT